jgi:hypothetical protein
MTAKSCCRYSNEESVIEAGGESVALNPCMSVTAEVKTGDRRVIEFLQSS